MSNPTPDQAARAAAEEIWNYDLVGENWGESPAKDRLAVIILRHVAPLAETMEAAKAECRSWMKDGDLPTEMLARRLLAILEGRDA